jgi:hypothetical protein
MKQIKDLNLLLTGAFLLLVALLAMYLSAPLSSVSEVGPGPGYMPKLFAFLQFGLGAVMVFNGFVQTGEASEPWHLRPVVLVLGSVAFFAMTIQSLGLVLSVMGLVFISCAANRETRFRESLALAVGCAAATPLLLVNLLGLSMFIWPPQLLVG